MAFTGDEGNPINQSKAGEWTRNYREANPGDVYSHFLGRDVLLSILSQHGCEGIRFYYGLDGYTPELIAVGADNEENDQLGTNFIVADEGIKGPPCSGEANILNS